MEKIPGGVLQFSGSSVPGSGTGAGVSGVGSGSGSVVYRLGRVIHTGIPGGFNTIPGVAGPGLLPGPGGVRG